MAGPDTLRAVYAAGDLTKDKFRKGRAGDTYIVIADWAPDGAYTLDTIHQYGSATMDAASPHYADRAPLFAAEQFKRPPMTLGSALWQKRHATTGPVERQRNSLRARTGALSAITRR